MDGAAYRYFREPSNRASGSVVFKTITKNRIHIIVLSGTANKPAFNEPRFKVILHATPGDIEYYFDAKEDSIVEIPDAESFDITVPSFQDGNGQTPTLIVHFRWSDRRVWNTNKIALIGTKTAKQQNGVGFGVLG